MSCPFIASEVTYRYWDTDLRSRAVLLRHIGKWGSFLSICFGQV